MIQRIFPFLAWFKDYDLGKFRADALSGLTVALVLIPQSMAYAQLAGLPAYYGLYAAFLPPFVAALFGSSRQLATGPVAVVSLMTAATLEPLATAGGEAYIAYAVFLALLVGLFQLSLGLLRLGVVVNFLSHPVVVGFTNAAALIIATSQLSKMFGVSVDKAEHHYETVWRVAVAAWHYTHWPTFLLGLLAFALMAGLKRINPRLPFVLVAVAITTVISWAVGLERKEVVPAEALAAPEVGELIGRFNADVRDIEVMSKARTELGPDLDRLSETGEGLCQSCHAEHSVNLEMLREGARGPAGAPEVKVRSQLELHAMAGLLDRHIAMVKESASGNRSQLRGILFEAVDTDGGLRFYPQGQAPQGVLAEGHTWRLRVGNRPLDPTQLTLTAGGSVVGDIPSGLPTLTLPVWHGSVFGKLFVAAIIISILGFMEAISIAKAMAARTGQRLDPNQELIGQGLANILGSCGQSYAVSGSFSRSAVNIQAGAQTGLSSVFTSAMVVVVLLFMTPLLYHLPQSVLAAVIMMAVIGLINFKAIVHAWRVQRADGMISVVTFIGTLAFAPHLDRGILIGVILSVGFFLYRKMKPAIDDLSLGSTGHLHSAEHNRLERCRHLAVIRFDGPMFFANTSYLEDEVLRRTNEMPGLKEFVFACDGVSHLDATAEEALSLLVERLRSAGYGVSFSGLTERIQEVMRRSHLLHKIGEQNIHPTAAVAVDALWKRAHADSQEQDCPLVKVVPCAGEVAEYRIRVLLVDDEPDFREYAAKRLKARQLHVETAEDGPAALARLRKQTFDVVLLDVAMPGMDGHKVFEQILKRWPEQQVIMLTGHGTIAAAVDSLKHGVADYLTKPVESDLLAEKIREVYRRSR